MGVGTPGNILTGVLLGIDIFDCVMPSRNARHGHLFTSEGIININNKKYEDDNSPIDKNCSCHVCKNHSKGYIRHLLKAGETLGQRLSVMHNLWFYNHLMQDIRNAISENCYEEFYKRNITRLDRRI